MHDAHVDWIKILRCPTPHLYLRPIGRSKSGKRAQKTHVHGRGAELSLRLACKLKSGGKPSTWLPTGGPVERSQKLRSNKPQTRPKSNATNVRTNARIKTKTRTKRKSQRTRRTHIRERTTNAANKLGASVS